MEGRHISASNQTDLPFSGDGPCELSSGGEKVLSAGLDRFCVVGTGTLTPMPRDWQIKPTEIREELPRQKVQAAWSPHLWSVQCRSRLSASLGRSVSFLHEPVAENLTPVYQSTVIKRFSLCRTLFMRGGDILPSLNLGRWRGTLIVQELASRAMICQIDAAIHAPNLLAVFACKRTSQC